MKNSKLLLGIVLGALCIVWTSCKTIDPVEELVNRNFKQVPFAVSDTSKVIFSQGNLQYYPDGQLWRFALLQTDCLGERNNNISSTYKGWIDLFGWSSDNDATKFGISTSENEKDFAGTFVDWGTNAIGDDAAGTWRTMAIEEWEYLFRHTRWTMAKVGDMLGLMLFPAEFNAPDGLVILGTGDFETEVFLKYKQADFADNVYSTSDFAEFEKQGVVFFPCAGERYGAETKYIGEDGAYWMSTPSYEGHAFYMYCNQYWTNVNATNYAYTGRSVRLVKDVK